MPGFGRKSVNIALAGVYDLQLHLDEVLAPVLRAWRIWELETLSDDGQIARTELAGILDQLRVQADTFVEKREAYFAKQLARGIQPKSLAFSS